ncbi:hypothetical protein [Streptomyces sp. N35]|uniref:hypothetical protein n=1 Tax=Streptomyces sp. N35 TaxID=2795730 RepID=UPI0018F3B89D|nr:hypothetical protein [Streptomyces sp. N35]
MAELTRSAPDDAEVHWLSLALWEITQDLHGLTRLAPDRDNDLDEDKDLFARALAAVTARADALEAEALELRRRHAELDRLAAEHEQERARVEATQRSEKRREALLDLVRAQ